MTIMDLKFKRVRELLNCSTKAELERIADEAMMSERQREIAFLRRKGCSNQAIAMRLHCDIGTINNEIRRIYKVTAKILLV